jgi:hypothetical protein
LKEELAHLKRLEEDCHSIQRSLAIIQSAQRILTLYTSDERRQLFKEYAELTNRRRNYRDRGPDPQSVLAFFRQDHADLVLIADVLARGSSVELSNLKIQP